MKNPQPKAQVPLESLSSRNGCPGIVREKEGQTNRDERQTVSERLLHLKNRRIKVYESAVKSVVDLSNHSCGRAVGRCADDFSITVGANCNTRAIAIPTAAAITL